MIRQHPKRGFYGKEYGEGEEDKKELRERSSVIRRHPKRGFYGKEYGEGEEKDKKELRERSSVIRKHPKRGFYGKEYGEGEEKDKKELQERSSVIRQHPKRGFYGKEYTVLEFLNNIWGARNRVGKDLSYTDKKENQIFLIYKEIQGGAVAKSYMTMGKYLRISSDIRKPFPIYDFATAPL